MNINPYTPGAGRVPRYLAGREKVMQEAGQTLSNVAAGFPARSVVFYGLRGVGKTVLLSALEEMALDGDIPYEYIEVSERGSFKYSLTLAANKLMRKLSVAEKAKNYAAKALGVLKAFQITYSKDGDVSIGLDPSAVAAIGTADTGDFQNDLTELFLSLGTLAQKTGQGVALLIDEIQYLEDSEFEALIAAMHRVSQRSLPLALFGAGLPKIAKLAGDVKSYSERLFRFIEIDSLDKKAAKLALAEPAEGLGVSFTTEALEQIVAITEGYPYFLQEYGQQAWKRMEGKHITLQAVQNARQDFEKALDESFFKVRHDRATAKELEFMTAMVKCGKLPCSINQVAEKLGRSYANISPLRAQLIHKGFIYAANRGELDFTVPQFDRYLKRVYGI
jgi:hypothetical protein